MQLLSKFIGTSRWKALHEAILRNSTEDSQPSLGTFMVTTALIIALTPPILTFLDANSGAQSVNPTIAFGACTVLAILVRRWAKLPFTQGPGWKNALSLTHTAVALGCVPAVAVLFFSPDLLAERHDILSEQVRPETQVARPSLIYAISMVILIAAWASVTEEIIFRGLLLGTLRRWRLIPKQWQRDVFAVSLSASIFGIAHITTWGPAAAIALVGLGAGFALAYIANGERLMPIILYHFCFNFLSIAVSVFA